MNAYLAAQLSGALAQAVANESLAQMEWFNIALEYFCSLTIQNAEQTEAEFLGLLAGYPWPSVAEGAFNDDSFTLGGVATHPRYDPSRGLGSLHDPGVGGLLISVYPSESAKMPISKYKALIAGVAQTKRTGLTLDAIDTLASIFGTGYAIGWGSIVTSDITVVFPSEVGSGNVLLMQMICDKLATSPQIQISLEL